MRPRPQKARVFSFMLLHIYVLMIDNTPIYVGQTQNVKSRYRSHLGMASVAEPHYDLHKHIKNKLLSGSTISCIVVFSCVSHANYCEMLFIAWYAKYFTLFNNRENEKYIPQKIQNIYKGEVNLKLFSTIISEPEIKFNKTPLRSCKEFQKINKKVLKKVE